MATEEPNVFLVTTLVALKALVLDLVERPPCDRPPSPVPDEGWGWETNASLKEKLGVSDSTLARWRGKGRLPYGKVGRLIYYSREDVDELLRAGMESSQP